MPTRSYSCTKAVLNSTARIMKRVITGEIDRALPLLHQDAGEQPSAAVKSRLPHRMPSAQSSMT